MTPIQEIEVFSKSGILLRFHIEDTRLNTEKRFVASGFFCQKKICQAALFQGVSFTEAFQGIVEKFSERLHENDDEIEWINNPCNTELFTITEQQDVLRALGLDTVELQVNGEAIQA